MSSQSFPALGVPARIATRLERDGITTPTPIQAATLPDALQGRDVCGRAPTGSGKTIAFGIPMVMNVPPAKPKRPTGLVLVPTRELASQVAASLTRLTHDRKPVVGTVYGGVAYGPQVSMLRRGVDIVVACPGRLEDLERQGHISLADVSMVVLDEADRLADMGFLPVVRRFLDAVRPDRQVLLFSATLDGDVDVLVRRYQQNPAVHDATPAREDARTRHIFWHVDRGARTALTADIVNARGPAVVFCRTKHGVDRLTKQLERSGVAAAGIHGDRSQSQRDRALAAFTAGRVQALVATDVAARGIHVDDVGAVVHFDLPATAKDYVHRSGRTGRAGADGLVVCLVDVAAPAAGAQLQAHLGYQPSRHRPDITALDDNRHDARHGARDDARPSARPPARPPRGDGGDRRPGRKPRARRRG